MEFEWDDRKNESNIFKHGYSFEEGAEMLVHEECTERYSPRNNEDRWVAVGKYHDDWLSVVYTKRGGVYRIISVRKAKNRERREYG